jgi:hypothetical protein
MTTLTSHETTQMGGSTIKNLPASEFGRYKNIMFCQDINFLNRYINFHANINSFPINIYNPNYNQQEIFDDQPLFVDKSLLYKALSIESVDS